jgi:hypothetical protein
MKEEKNIDELFRDKLANYEQAPPAYLLDNILSGVASKDGKRKIVFWRVAGIAAALLLAFVAGWQISDLNNKKTELVVGVSKINAPEIKTGKANTVTESLQIQDQNQETKIVSGTSGRLATVKNTLTANRISIKEKIIPSETLKKSGTEEIDQMKPVKRLEKWIKQENEMPLVLSEMKIQDTDNKLEELTIDQQIMRQNQQTITAEKLGTEKARWIIGAQVSPVYSVSRSNHSPIYASNMLNSSPANPVDLGGGISVEFKRAKRWSLQSGIYYSTLGQSSVNSASSSRNNFLFGDPGNSSNYFNTKVHIDPGTNKMSMNSPAGVIEFSSIPSGIEIGTNIEGNSLAPAVVVSDAKFIQNFEYIEIPLYLRYTILDSSFGIEMLGGFSSNLLVGNQTFMESSGSNNLVGKTNDMQAINYSGTLGIGLKYSLSKCLYLNVEPRIKCFLNSLNSSASVTYKPYSMGVYTGISYQF